MPKIVVIGSSNTDMVVKAQCLPAPGETLSGKDFSVNSGGKGANQAVAAARLEADVTFVGKVGNDSYGREAIQGFQREAINTDYITMDSENPSGIAMITVADNGQNSIVVALGANNTLSPHDVDAAMVHIDQADFLLLQLEIPLETVKYAAALGRREQKRVILNPAPARFALPNSLFGSLDVITPNEMEAELITGVKITGVESAERAARVLYDKGVGTVIITMGAAGAFILSKDIMELVPSVKVVAVDTTAAGDTFNGALAVGLANGKEIVEAVQFANSAASISVTQAGAQSSCPRFDEANDFFKQHYDKH